METKRINLTGNRSLINNKAHIDENWEKFSKNNSPYLRDALVPHYLKEESKNVASNIVFDKEGNKYYVDNDNFFVNDEAVGGVSSLGFKKTDLEENYQCYDKYAYSSSEVTTAYMIENMLYVEKGDQKSYYLYEKEILLTRVVARRYGALFLIVYRNEENLLYADIIALKPTSYTPSISSTRVTWGQLINGTTWTPIGDDVEVMDIKCNITKQFETEIPSIDPTYGTIFSLIGKLQRDTKESSWCFHNILLTYDEEALSLTLWDGTHLEFEAVSGEITITNNWTVDCSVIHTREYGKTEEENEFLRDNFKFVLSDKTQGNTNVPISVVINYRDYEDNPQTLSGSFSISQQEITLSRYIENGVTPDCRQRLNEMFNVTSITLTQRIKGVDYTKSIPVENITYTPGTIVEHYWNGYKNPITAQDWVNFVSQYVNNGAPTALTWTWNTTETLTEPSTGISFFEDDGTIRSVPVYDYKAGSITEYIVSAEINTITKYISDPIAVIRYMPTQMYKNTSTYTYFASSSYNIGQSYFDVLFAVFDNSYTENKTHNFYTNSGLRKEMIGDIGMTNNGSTPYVYSGAKGKLWTTQYGAITPLGNTKWRALFNYGVITNISYGSLNEEGTILSDWNTIDEGFYISYTDDEIMYKDTTGFHKITIEEIKNNVQIFEDNYVLMNTTSYLNCWDIKNKKFVHFASDFNNRCYTGWQASKYGYFTQDGSWKDTWEANKWESESTPIYCAAGQNVNYAITGDPIVSTIFPPQNLYHVVKNKEFYCFGDNASIDIYYNLVYQNSIKNNFLKYVNAVLYPDAQYPLSSNNVNYFNIPLLLFLIKTYNNRDLVKSGAMFYPVIYYNDSKPIFIYSTLGGLDGATNMFVIQSQFYAVMGGKICAVSYAENVVSNVEAIIDVSGMQFIGYLPTFALFYSPKNKNIYSFTGDANLEKIDDASEIGNLKHALYNSFTKTIHVITDKGVCIIGDTIYMIEFPGIEEIFFTKDFSVLETTDKLYKLSFEKLSDEYSVLPLIFETEFFGGLNDSVTTIYKWSMRFIKDSVANGKIKLSTVTLTDKGSETREKVYNVSNADWDKLTDSFYIQFCPENNKATGHKIRIESDFPLTSLIAQITTDGSLTAAKNTMKI